MKGRACRCADEAVYFLEANVLDTFGVEKHQVDAEVCNFNCCRKPLNR